MKSTQIRAIFALAALASFLPSAAWACGGFFCFTQPVDQSAERILYVQDADKIAVHIQISYTGDDDQFSWILPLQSVPELGIGSDTIFQILEQETAPRFTLEWKNTPKCSGYQPCLMMDAAAGGSSSGGTGTNGGVEVLKQGNVGPYDFVVLKSSDATELINWLNKNKYVQPAESKPLIEAYVAKQHVFLALKLSKDSSAGDIAPIVVILDETSPCLPLRLTSIAAQPDMPIVAWTLGPARAIPKNFLHVVLNDAALDWMKPGSNYKTVVSKAVDQASGHAFTTEYAKKTASFKRTFANPNWKPQALESITDPLKFMQKLLADGYPRTTQMQDLLRTFIPKPDKFKDVKDNEFYNCLGQEWNNNSPCSDYKAAVKTQAFDPKGFVVKLQKFVVAPLQEMDEDVKGHAWLTRLYTTVDPQEMDKDPIFGFNKSLPEVDNVRKAVATPICEGTSQQATKAELEFADGNKLVVTLPKDDNCVFDFTSGTTAFGKGDDPAVKEGGQPAMRIEVLDETGAPLLIHPKDADQVDARLSSAVAGKPSLDDAFIKTLADPKWAYTDPNFTPGKSTTNTSSGGGSTSGGTTDPGTTQPTTRTSDSGCSASGNPRGAHNSGSPWLWLALVMLPLMLIRRREPVPVRESAPQR